MTRYDKRSVAYHWISAALILTLWLLGQNIDWFSRGDPRVYARSMHILLGVILGLIIALRLMWRRTGGAQLPPASAGLQGRLAIGVHHLLYALVTAIVLVGLACVWIRGDNIFNLFKLPVFDPSNPELRHTAVGLHGLLANILLALSACHAAAALWHHLIVKDKVLARMLPFLK